MRSRPGPLPPTLDDVEAGRASAEAVLAREEGDGAFLSWEEVEALARAGVFEFESHTLTHARIHVAPVLAGFLRPERRRGYEAMDVPLVADGSRDLLADEVPLGTPLLASAPRTSEELRFFEDPDLRTACVAAVAAGGGEAFFQNADWEAQLRRLVARQAIRGRVETPEERAAALRRELATARHRHRGAHGPSGGAPLLPLARRRAHRTTAGPRGRLPNGLLRQGARGRRVPRRVGDPLAIARIGEDYVELLPGRGRVSLATVLRRKWARRLRGA